MLGVFLDLESTGLNPKRHRTIEIALKIVDLHSGQEKAAYESVVYQPHEVWYASDPSSLVINGFTWERVRMGHTEQEVAQDIVSLLNYFQIKRKAAVFICQNPSFDRVFFSQIIDVDIQEKFQWPYHWLDFASMYWAISTKELIQEEGSSTPFGLSKDEIARGFGLPPESQPHRAMNGVNHLILCYKTVVGYPAYREIAAIAR